MCEVHARGLFADLLREAGAFVAPRDVNTAKECGRKVSTISSWFVCNVHMIAESRGRNGQEETTRLLVAFLEGILEANGNEFPVKSDFARKHLWTKFRELRSLAPSRKQDTSVPTRAA